MVKDYILTFEMYRHLVKKDGSTSFACGGKLTMFSKLAGKANITAVAVTDKLVTLMWIQDITATKLSMDTYKFFKKILLFLLTIFYNSNQMKVS